MSLSEAARVGALLLTVLLGMLWLAVTLLAVMAARQYGLYAIWPLHVATVILVPGLLWLSKRPSRIA